MRDLVRSLAGALALAAVGHGIAFAGGSIVGKVEASKPKYAVNTIVFLEKVPGDFKPPAEHVVIDQKNLQFNPHVLPILAGTTVDFLNSDEVLHNVFTPDKCAGKFNLGSWPQGERRSHLFDRPGCSAVMLCNVHPEMEAYIVVLGNPYFTVTDAEGKFKLDAVPAGTYTVKVWHERLKADPVEVTVPEGGKAEVSFSLKR